MKRWHLYAWHNAASAPDRISSDARRLNFLSQAFKHIAAEGCRLLSDF